MRVVYLMLTLTVVSCVQAPRPYINDSDCPRKPDLAVHRKCLKKCRTDLDCRGRNRQCLCDDVCGKACVKPSQKCETLKPIFNGKYELDTFNILGAKVHYSCNKGYILRGSPERVCQGDGYWSGTPPTCDEQDVMSDTAMIPTLGKCMNPPVVDNAGHDGPEGQLIFPLGTQLNYKCDDGYDIDGFFRSMCVGDGRWVGPRMTCSPRRCGHPGDIPNGIRDGNAFVYPNRVTYKCKEGYEMIGRSFRMCMANRQWSGSLPTCIPTKCPRLTASANGELQGTDNTYGAIARFSCHKGFQMKGTEIRRCQQNGKWSGEDAYCIQLDCGQPGPFYNGYLDGGSTTYGSEYKFRCYGRTTFEGPSLYTTCQENGKWSHPVPKCWKRCPIPYVVNATVETDEGDDDYKTHGDTLNITCTDGHVLNTRKLAQCYNGSWTFVPRCVPAPCATRPSEIHEGYVRFYTMNHGDKAKYKCNTGYSLRGDEFVHCLYGQWIGNVPICEAVYCPYPGTIGNGTILLVGMIGKYEYREYVKRIEHNQEIEFHCNKEFKRVGAAAATCVDGKWSPSVLPKCVPRQHPKLLYLFRGRRSVRTALPLDTSAKTYPQSVLPATSQMIPDTGLDKEQDWNNEKGFCEVPSLENAVKMSVAAGYYVPHGSILSVECSPRYIVLPPSGRSVCTDGTWSEEVACLDPDGSEEVELMMLKNLDTSNNIRHANNQYGSSRWHLTDHQRQQFIDPLSPNENKRTHSSAQDAEAPGAR